MGEVLFAHVYGMNAIPAPLRAALVDRSGGVLEIRRRIGRKAAIRRLPLTQTPDRIPRIQG